MEKDDASKNEEELLERVFLKIVLAETDDQFEKLLSNFLGAILMKLTSGKEIIKNKVLEILTHVNKRLKSRPRIMLPVDELLLQYQDPKCPSFVQNFTILYIKMGYPRLDEKRKSELIPQMFASLPKKGSTHQDLILRLVIQAISDLTYPESIQQRKSLCPVTDDKDTTKVILDFLFDFLLLPYSSENRDQGSDRNAPLAPPPGLSVSSMKRLTFEPSLTGDEIEKAKLGAIKFLTSELFPAVNIMCHLVAATGDSRSSVSEAADHGLKKFSSSADWERDAIVDKLFKLFQGTMVARGNSRQALTQDQARSPVNTLQKMRIFPYLLKSKRAVDFHPAGCVQIIFEGLFGDNTNPKLKKYSLQFCHNVCRHSSDKSMAFAAPLMFQACMKVISDNKTERSLHFLGYTGLGLVARRAPYLFKRDVAIVQKLLETLEEEDKDMRLAVQETLSTIAPCYAGISGSNAHMMEALILSKVEKENPACNLASLQLANSVFPKSHVPSRYACLLSSGNVKDDVREEARKGLSATKWKDVFAFDDSKEDEITYPDFVELVAYLTEKGNERKKQRSETASLYYPPVQEKILMYTRDCLRASANVTEKELLDEDTLPKVADYVKRLTSSVETSEVVYSYVDLIRTALLRGPDPNVQLAGLQNLLEVLCCAPDKLGPLLHKDIEWIKSLMKSGREDVRYFTARVLSALCSSLPYDHFTSFLDKMIQDLNKSVTLEMKHGTILCLAFCVTDLLGENNAAQDIERSDSMPGKSTKTYDIVALIARQLYSDDALLKQAACTALGIIGRRMALPLPEGTEDEGNDSTPVLAKKLKTEQVSKLMVVGGLIEMLSRSKEVKLKEKAAKTLGYVCVVDRGMSHVAKVIRALLETSKERQIELNFSVGEALSCVGAGLVSKASRDLWSLDRKPVQDHKADEDHMKTIVESIIKDYVYSSAAFHRQAAAIWLMSIVKFSSDHGRVKSLLKEFQTAFINLLSDHEELTQEIASRGINIVYELVEEENKNEVVQLLVDCLMSGKRPKHDIDADSELFTGGLLGKAPDGGSLSTYKELCSLASSLNKPELIYKFMNLANHSSIWNSKKGAAFGFLGIASVAKKQLQPYLPSLVPRLYRYQYDPNPGVHQAMSSIWSALVPEGRKVLDTYGDAILNDLKENMVNALWRNRESSCLALADLLKVVQGDELLPHLSDIWKLLFKVMDDIKESVRNVAMIAVKSLNKVTVRMCDMTLSKHGEKTISVILPLLLESGLGSRVAEVRAVSLQTLVQLSKSAGNLMKPHIPKFAVALLEALSALEPQALNTLNLQISSSQEAQERLDNLRISSSKSSPMMEAMKTCVQYVDQDVLKEMVPQLCDLMKSGIGLRTKVGCADFVSSIVLHARDDMTPFSGRLLKGLLNGARDNNSAVRSAYASCIGRLVQYSKKSSVERVINRLNEWYLKKEGDKSSQQCSANVYLAILRYSPDHLKEYSSICLPTIFLAMHEEKTPGLSGSCADETSEAWAEIWSGLTPGTVVGIKQYLKELVDAVCFNLGSPSWSIRAQAGKAGAKIAESLGSSLDNPYLSQLVNAFLEAIPGRVWEGKAHLVKSLSTLCQKCCDNLKKDDQAAGTCDRVLKALLKECKKDNFEYRIAVFSETADVIQSFGADLFSDIKPIIDRLLSKDDEDDDEDDEKRKSRSRKIEGALVAYTALGKSWPRESKTQDLHKSYVIDICAEAMENVSWKSQSAILQSLTQIFDRFDWPLVLRKWEANDNEPFGDYVVKLVIPKVCSCAENASVAAVIVSSLSCLSKLATRLDENDALHLMMDFHGRICELLKLLVKQSNFRIDELSKILWTYLEKIKRLKDEQRARERLDNDLQ